MTEHTDNTRDDHEQPTSRPSPRAARLAAMAGQVSPAYAAVIERAAETRVALDRATGRTDDTTGLARLHALTEAALLMVQAPPLAKHEHVARSLVSLHLFRMVVVITREQAHTTAAPGDGSPEEGRVWLVDVFENAHYTARIAERDLNLPPDSPTSLARNAAIQRAQQLADTRDRSTLPHGYMMEVETGAAMIEVLPPGRHAPRR